MGERHRAAAERAAHEVGVARLERGRREHVAGGDQRAETGGVRLDLGFHPVGEHLGVAVGPRARELAAGVTAGEWGTWVYAQTVSVPGGERVGSALFIWPISTNGWAGILSCARSAAYAVMMSMCSARCTVPARVDGSARHGIGPDSAQSTLNVPWSVLEPFEVGDDPRRQMLLPDEVAVERGRADVGEHAARRGDRLAVGEHDRDRPPVAHLDPNDARRAPDGAAARIEPAHERGGQLTGATFGHGEAVLLTETREHPAEEPAGGTSGPTSLCMALPASRSAAPSPAKRSWASRRTESSDWRVNSSSPRGPSAAASRSGPRTGGNGVHHRVEQRPAHPAEIGVEGAPRVAVTGGERVERRRGLVDVGRQDRAPTVGRRVREHDGAYRQRSPYDSSSSARITGDATPSG